MKLNQSGDIEWQNAMGGSGEDYGKFIQQTNDNGYILTGLTESNNGDVLNNDGCAEVWVVKLQETGEIQWQKTLGGSQPEAGFLFNKPMTMVLFCQERLGRTTVTFLESKAILTTGS